MRLVYLCILLAGCSYYDAPVFHYNSAQYPSNKSDAIEVSLLQRSTLVSCGEIVGTLERTDPLIVPYEASRRGATHFVMVGNTVECWYADIKCVSGK